MTDSAAFVPGYDYDVYVSFAREDDAETTGPKDEWVKTLISDLKRRLPQQLGSVAVHTANGDQSEERLSDEVKKRIQSSATLLVILSSAYLKSSRCEDELNCFLGRKGDPTFSDRRIIVVHRDRTQRHKRPLKLQDLRGYRFWWQTEPVGLDTDHPIFNSPESSAYYYLELDRLRERIRRELRRLKITEASIPTSAPESTKAESKFDVFLCHNSEDKRSVRKIADELEKCGIRTWLDEKEIMPGGRFVRELAEAIEGSRSVAVFVGNSGIGPWHKMEYEHALEDFVDQKHQVIPVILSDAPKKPELPAFLRGFHWVDFRNPGPCPGPLQLLRWGITGDKPDWRPAVLVGEVTTDLYWKRAEIAALLDREGLRVLPEIDLYPEGPIQFASALDRELSNCRFFVQLLSDANIDNESGWPPDFAQIQFERARAAKTKILQWCPPGLHNKDEFRDFKKAGTLDAVNFEEFKTIIGDAARQVDDVPVSKGVPRVNISDETKNPELVRDISSELMEHGIHHYPSKEVKLGKDLYKRFGAVIFAYTADDVSIDEQVIGRVLDCSDERELHQPPPFLMGLCQGLSRLGRRAFSDKDCVFIDGSEADQLKAGVAKFVEKLQELAYQQVDQAH